MKNNQIIARLKDAYVELIAREDYCRKMREDWRNAGDWHNEVKAWNCKYETYMVAADMVGTIIWDIEHDNI